RCLTNSCILTQRSLTSTPFPYTTLFRSLRSRASSERSEGSLRLAREILRCAQDDRLYLHMSVTALLSSTMGLRWDRLYHKKENRDRKSTRLNSSHSQISYAVFCLKKKKK